MDKQRGASWYLELCIHAVSGLHSSYPPVLVLDTRLESSSWFETQPRGINSINGSWCLGGGLGVGVGGWGGSGDGEWGVVAVAVVKEYLRFPVLAAVAV